MLDYLLQAFEARLVMALQEVRYSDLQPEDVPRILRGMRVALDAPTLSQGAKELLVLLSDSVEGDEEPSRT